MGYESGHREGRNNLAGFVSVRNSNHYGITAYYSEMALKRYDRDSHDQQLPSGGADVRKRAVLGTNPFSIAIPVPGIPSYWIWRRA